jgi:hypothetical protein
MQSASVAIRNVTDQLLRIFDRLLVKITTKWAPVSCELPGFGRGRILAEGLAATPPLPNFAGAASIDSCLLNATQSRHSHLGQAPAKTNAYKSLHESLSQSLFNSLPGMHSQANMPNVFMQSTSHLSHAMRRLFLFQSMVTYVAWIRSDKSQ